MAKYRCEYIYSLQFGKPNHIWTCIGAAGALHLHIRDCGEEDARKYAHGERFSGGIEIHYRSAPDYMQGDAPSSDNCWVLKCPCWHDGSSLQASEFWIPLWRGNPHDHDGMFRMLSRRMDEQFAPPSSED